MAPTWESGRTAEMALVRLRICRSRKLTRAAEGHEIESCSDSRVAAYSACAESWSLDRPKAFAVGARVVDFDASGRVDSGEGGACSRQFTDLADDIG